MVRRLKHTGPDTRSIDISDAYAVEFWARELNVTKKKLNKAVLEAGTWAADVKRELHKARQ